MPDRWLSLQEISAMLGLSEKSVLRLRRQGLPMRRVSPRGARGILESELVAWLKKRPRDGPVVQPAK